MMRTVWLWLLPLVSWAQAGSEIFLFDVSAGGGKMILSNPQNITQHPGYDNQPYFHSSQPLLYYSSFNDEGRADIKVYNYSTAATTALTQTSEREYSPTLTPDQQFISCIIQRDNQAQDLGKYPVGGGEAIVLIDDLIVGYHAWVDDHNLILFVLGEPLTLRWYDLRSKKNDVLAEGIGRSLHRIPGEKAMSFVQKKPEDAWWIMRLDSKTREMTPIVQTLKEREDLTWTPGGSILMSDGERLYQFDPEKPAEGWQALEWNEDGQWKGITRLAMSPDGRKLAVVVSE